MSARLSVHTVAPSTTAAGGSFPARRETGPRLDLVDAFLAGDLDALGRTFSVDAARLEGVSDADVASFQSAVSNLVDNSIRPAVQALAAEYAGDYRRAAPSSVGQMYSALSGRGSVPSNEPSYTSKRTVGFSRSATIPPISWSIRSGL